MHQVILNKYTNTASLNSLSTVCSTKSVAISINLIEFRFYKGGVQKNAKYEED
jgi:hypothetical protein